MEVYEFCRPPILGQKAFVHRALPYMERESVLHKAFKTKRHWSLHISGLVGLAQVESIGTLCYNVKSLFSEFPFFLSSLTSPNFLVLKTRGVETSYLLCTLSVWKCTSSVVLLYWDRKLLYIEHYIYGKRKRFTQSIQNKRHWSLHISGLVGLAQVNL